MRLVSTWHLQRETRGRPFHSVCVQWQGHPHSPAVSSTAPAWPLCSWGYYWAVVRISPRGHLSKKLLHIWMYTGKLRHRRCIYVPWQDRGYAITIVQSVEERKIQGWLFHIQQHTPQCRVRIAIMVNRAHSQSSFLTWEKKYKLEYIHWILTVCVIFVMFFIANAFVDRACATSALLECTWFPYYLTLKITRHTVSISPEHQQELQQPVCTYQCRLWLCRIATSRTTYVISYVNNAYKVVHK